MAMLVHSFTAMASIPHQNLVDFPLAFPLKNDIRQPCELVKFYVLNC